VRDWRDASEAVKRETLGVKGEENGIGLVYSVSRDTRSSLVWFV